MRHLLRCACLTGVLALLVTAFAADLPAQVAKPPEPKLPATGNVDGKLIMAGASSKTLTVQVEMQVYEPNKVQPRNNNSQAANLFRRQMDLQRQQAQIMQARSPQQRMQAMQQLQRTMAQLQMEMARMQIQPQQAPFKVVTKKQDFEIQADDDTKVYYVEPPLKFDDKGNPVKYTPEEVKKIKGNSPYFPGEFAELKPGHLVKVTLGKKAIGGKGKDLDKTVVESNLPYATSVVVTGEDVPPAGAKKKK